MLEILIESPEGYDEVNNKFISPEKPILLVLEHSLVSISKWESKWHKTFLDKSYKKTDLHMLDYIRCMTVNKAPLDVYSRLTEHHLIAIKEYTENPMTAHNYKSNSVKTSKSNELMTSEYLYASMIALNIPFECQKWHINRLINLIQKCSNNNTPPKERKRISKIDHATSMHDINMKRRMELNSTG